jgi:hypothetical protein
MFQIIQNMYKDIKSNIVYNNDKSEFFPCDNGVRQRRKYVSLFVVQYSWNLFNSLCNSSGDSDIRTVSLA